MSDKSRLSYSGRTNKYSPDRSALMKLLPFVERVERGDNRLHLNHIFPLRNILENGIHFTRAGKIAHHRILPKLLDSAPKLRKFDLNFFFGAHGRAFLRPIKLGKRGA